MERGGERATGGAQVRVRLVVRGRVQGVWYRGSARDEARRRGIVGWARNLADGSVEVVAQGSRESIEVLAAWCHRGPPGARVSSVAREPLTPGDELADFHVR